MVAPLFVGRDKTVRALEEAMNGDKSILLVTQKNEHEDDPTTDAIYETGVIANVLQLLKLPDGTVKVLVEGRARAKVLRYTDETAFYQAEVVARSKRPAATPTRPKRCRAPWSSSSKPM